MFVNILALGSPTHPGPAEPVGAMDRALSEVLAWRGADPAHRLRASVRPASTARSSSTSAASATQSMRKAGFDYFENSRRETYANRAYCIANPMGWRGYSDAIVGTDRLRRTGRFPAALQRRDARNSSAIRRAGPIGEPDGRDDGTIAPTAALGSLPFAPEIVIPCAEALMQQPRLVRPLRVQGQLQPELHLSRREGRNRHGRSANTAGSRRIISASTRDRSCSRRPTTATISSGATCAGCRRSGADSSAPDSPAAGWPTGLLNVG